MSSKETRAVFRGLFASRPQDRHESVGYMFSLASGQEEYRRQAIAWLGDNSELSTPTLDAADWSEIYAHFSA